MEELNPIFDKVARYFSLLSDPSRLKVIHSVCNAEMSVNDVVLATGLSQSTVSRHLSSLHSAGVASRRKVGTLALYAMTDDTLTQICRSACVDLISREVSDAKSLAQSKRHVSKFMAAQ
jgi:DNA-binding transcriptional ArsR family regulator